MSARASGRRRRRGDVRIPTTRLVAGGTTDDQAVHGGRAHPNGARIRKRSDIKINLEHLRHLVKAAAWLSSLSIPVRLIAFPEGALQAFNDEVLDLDHATFARECAIDIPGEETEALGKIAREYDVFIIAQAKARHPDWKDRFFNVGFILNPRGRVILQHYKVSPLFPSSTRCARTTSTIGGWRSTGGAWRRSGRWSTPRSAGSAS